MNDEIWLPYKGYEGFYEISSKGHARSVNHLSDATSGYWKQRLVRGRILKPEIRNGYYSVLFCKNGVVTKKTIHRLVAETFIPNPESKPQVNHINGDKLDNRIENLEWTTVSENTTHAYRVLKVYHPMTKRETNHLCKKVYCCNFDMEFTCVTEAAEALDVGRKEILKVASGEIGQVKGLVFRYI